jgi:hypothetical protein
MKIGDTVSTGQDVVLDSTIGQIIPKGSKALVIGQDEDLSACRLYFNFLNKKDDFYNLDVNEWNPQVCRRILIEKVIYPLQLNEFELVNYFNDGQLNDKGKELKRVMPNIFPKRLPTMINQTSVKRKVLIEKELTESVAKRKSPRDIWDVFQEELIYILADGGCLLEGQLLYGHHDEVLNARLNDNSIIKFCEANKNEIKLFIHIKNDQTYSKPLETYGCLYVVRLNYHHIPYGLGNDHWNGFTGSKDFASVMAEISEDFAVIYVTSSINGAWIVGIADELATNILKRTSLSSSTYQASGGLLSKICRKHFNKRVLDKVGAINT